MFFVRTKLYPAATSMHIIMWKKNRWKRKSKRSKRAYLVKKQYAHPLALSNSLACQAITHQVVHQFLSSESWELKKGSGTALLPDISLIGMIIRNLITQSLPLREDTDTRAFAPLAQRPSKPRIEEFPSLLSVCSFLLSVDPSFQTLPIDHFLLTRTIKFNSSLSLKSLHSPELVDPFHSITKKCGA